MINIEQVRGDKMRVDRVGTIKIQMYISCCSNHYLHVSRFPMFLTSSHRLSLLPRLSLMKTKCRNCSVLFWVLATSCHGNHSETEFKTFGWHVIALVKSNHEQWTIHVRKRKLAVVLNNQCALIVPCCKSLCWRSSVISTLITPLISAKEMLFGDLPWQILPSTTYAFF